MEPPAAPRALLATDLDGTLFGDDGRVSPRTRAALDQARSSDLAVVFVTGRPPSFLLDLADQTGHAGLVICANGAMVFDLGAWRPRRVHTMAPADLSAVAEAIGALDPDAEFRTMLHRDADEPVRLIGTGEAHQRQVRAHLEDGWLPYKVAVYGNAPDLDPDGFHADVAGQLRGLLEVTHSIPSVPFLEIGPGGVHKGTALAAHARELGVAQADVHAVGDMPNDLPMLAWAGHSYAVANAHPTVRQAAGRVVPANTDDGVAELIESLLAR